MVEKINVIYHQYLNNILPRTLRCAVLKKFKSRKQKVINNVLKKIKIWYKMINIKGVKYKVKMAVMQVRVHTHTHTHNIM